MLTALYKIFSGQLGLSADLWLTVMILAIVVAFAVTLVLGLVGGKLKKVKSAMKLAVSKPNNVVAAMKRMPADIKAQYKNTRMGNLRPSMLVTEDVCVYKPYKSSCISKVWIVTLAATLICAGIAFAACGIAPVSEEIADETELAALLSAPSVALAGTLVIGGLLTLIGAVIGRAVYSGAQKTYEKFVHVLDGDKVNGASPAMSEPQATYAEPQQTYAEPQAYAAEPQQAYAENEPQQNYSAEPQQVYAEPMQDDLAQSAGEQSVVVEPQQDIEEEMRRKAREEALAKAREEALAAQAQAKAQAQAEAQAQAKATASSSVDDVIAKIEKIDREGASREAMREVATLLQKERAKPENKTPEQQKRLNAALSKLLKAMSAASKK